MPPQFMYDAANAPSLTLCRQRGAICMSHYMIRSYAGSSPQPDTTRRLGMGSLLNAEGFAAELKGASRAKGRSFAEEALATLEPGVPRNGSVKIFYSVDTDLTNLTVCDEAFRGINDVHNGTGIQVGLYGEGGLIERLHAMGLVQGGQWLSMSEGFGGFAHALRSGLVAVVQMHDAAGNWIGTDVPGTDRNTILDPHSLGAWWPDGSSYATPGVDMPLTLADVKMLFNADNIIPSPDATSTNKFWSLTSHVATITATVRSTAKIVATVPGRLAALQAAVDALDKKVTGLQSGAVQVTPTDVPAILHIGGHQ